MKLKKMLLAFVAVLGSLSFFTSCEKEPCVCPKTGISNGVYVLNAGKFKNNNASITYFSFNTGFSSGDIFLSNNNRGLGDTGEDMVIYGSKMYVAVYQSSLIEVIDPKTAKSIKTIPMKDEAGNASSPRTLTTANGKVYIVLYNGHVTSMDTTSFAIGKTIKVGPNPDGSVIANNKLYVANTGGMAATGKDSTISVIDLAKFEEIKKIKVHLNPQKMGADSKGNVYVASFGNYEDIPGKFQKITDDKTVKDLKINEVRGFDITGDKAYIYTFSYDEKFQATNKKIMLYDVTNEKIMKDNIVTGAIEKTPYSIDVDPKTKDIYLGVTDYVNNGRMYCFKNDGSLKYTFMVGVNPCKTIFMNN